MLEERRRDELASGRGDLEREASVGRGEQAGDAGVGLAAGVGERDDVELEALGRMHREDPDGIDLLLGERRLRLLRRELREGADEREEAGEVGSAQRLVVACEADQLAHVGVAAAAVGLRETGEVVVVLGHDALEQIGDGELLRRVHEPVEALPERPHQPRVVLVKAVRQPVLEPAEERGLGRAAKRVETRVGDADERRREHGEQRPIVVAAADQPEVGAQVGHLLAPVVAAADRAVGVEPGLLERRLVQVGVRARTQEHHHLRLRVTLLAQLGEACRELARLTLARDADRACLLDHEQLEGRAVRGRGGAAPRDEPLEPVLEDVAEELVEDADERVGRAEAVVQPHDGLGAVAAPAEDLHVRVAEAVDALALVPHVHPLGVVAGDQLEDRVLQRVRVLELVDEQVPDAGLHGGPRIGVADEQIARAQLEVGEVERGRRELACGVDAVEALHEPDDLRVQGARDLASRGELHQRQLHLVGPERARRVLEPVGGEVDELLGRRVRAGRRRAARRGRCSRSDRRRRSSATASSATSSSARRAASMSSTRGGGGSRSRPQERRRSRRRSTSQRSAPATERRQQIERGTAVRLGRLREALLEGLAADDLGRRLVEDPELGVEPERERVLAQDRAAQTVDRRDRDALGALGQPGERQTRADALGQLARRALGERDDEDRLGVDARLDGEGGPLDEHRRLAAARAGRDEHDPARLDGGALRIAQGGRHARHTRQIGWASHQDGHAPPVGSWRTSPRRMRPTAARAVSTASCTSPQKASSSR